MWHFIFQNGFYDCVHDQQNVNQRCQTFLFFLLNPNCTYKNNIFSKKKKKTVPICTKHRALCFPLQIEFEVHKARAALLQYNILLDLMLCVSICFWKCNLLKNWAMQTNSERIKLNCIYEMKSSCAELRPRAGNCWPGLLNLQKCS